MDFYKQLVGIRKWNEFIDFLEVTGLQILQTDISFLNWLRKLLGLTYSAKIVIGNSIVTYQLDTEILETENITFIKIKDIKII